MDERPPVVWIPSLATGAQLLAWINSPSGWWAHVAWLSFAPNEGFSPRADVFVENELLVHSSLLQPRNGWTYTTVPRLHAGTVESPA